MAHELRLIETTVSGDIVRMLYADAESKVDSTEFVELSLKASGDDNRRLGVIHRAALLRLRALVDREDARLKVLADQIPSVHP
jgi:hypothetical protein